MGNSLKVEVTCSFALQFMLHWKQHSFAANNKEDF